MRTFTIAFLLSLTGSALAQIKPVATASLDRDSILIGEQITLSISVEYDINIDSADVHWPMYTDSITEHLQIVRKGALTTEPGITPSTAVQRQDWIITSFDSGYFVLPPMVFEAASDTGFTDPMLVYSTTVAVDMQAEIKDIKEIYEADTSWWARNKWWVIGFGSALALLALAVWWMKRRPTEYEEEVVETGPPLPMHQQMINQLMEVQRQQLWQRGMVKEHYIEVSTILRTYINLRFGVNALEKTSDDLLLSLRFEEIDYESRRKLRHILLMSDMVKFARETPMPSENEQSVREAIEFIQNTRKVDRPTLEVPTTG